MSYLGDFNPSGHLPYTVGKSIEDYGPSAAILKTAKTLSPQQNFSEGLLIDYRHFDFYNITPRYEFGFGLTYTTWKLSSGQLNYINAGDRYKALPKPRTDRADGILPPTLPITLPDVRTLLFPPGFRKLTKYIYPYIENTKNIDPAGKPQYPPNMTPSVPSQAGGGQGGNPDLFTTLILVRATLTNTGNRAGSCVVQVYVSLPQDYYDAETGETISSPVRVLRNFQKIEIEEHNARAEVKITLTRKDLSYWSTVRQNWVLPQKKDIRIEMGFSSRDLPIVMTY